MKKSFARELGKISQSFGAGGVLDSDRIGIELRLSTI